MKVSELPRMAAPDVIEHAADWLHDHFGWHTPISIAKGITLRADRYADVRDVAAALRVLGDERTANRGELRVGHRHRPVWSYNRRDAA